MTAADGTLSRGGRWLVLSVAFLGWMFAGLEMSIIPLVVRPVILSFEQRRNNPQSHAAKRRREVGNRRGKARRQVARLVHLRVLVGRGQWRRSVRLVGRPHRPLARDGLGHPLLFDLHRRVVSGFAAPEELLVLRFLACMGVGGIWPNGVALVSEAWSDVSRPTLAGLIGAAANLGFVLLGLLGMWIRDHARILALGLCRSAERRVVLGVFAWLFVPESPEWLASRRTGSVKPAQPMATIFRPPLLKIHVDRDLPGNDSRRWETGEAPIG